jgi:hypothetical protein
MNGYEKNSKAVISSNLKEARGRNITAARHSLIIYEVILRCFVANNSTMSSTVL